MTTKKFTLLELHLGDGTVQIGPATIGEEATPGGEPGDGGDADAAGADEESSGRCPARTAGKLLLAVVVLALVAAAVRSLLGDEGLDDLEELEDLAGGEE